MRTNFNARVKSTRAAVGFFLAMAAVCVAPLPASAQAGAQGHAATQSDAERAQVLFHRAKADVDSNNLNDAMRNFSEAWRLSKTSEVAANLAIVEAVLGHHRDAAEHFRFALSNLSPSTTDEQEQAIVTGLDSAKRHVLTLVIQSAPAGASISIDGVIIGRAPLTDDVYVEPGPHSVQAEAPGFQSLSLPIEGAAGTTHAVPMDLKPIAEKRVPNVASSPPTPPRPSGVSPRTIVLWSGVGVTAASLGVAIGFVLKGASLDDDATKISSSLRPGECAPATAPPACGQLESILNDRNNANKVANVSLVVAGAAAVATMATVLLWPRRKPKDAASFRLVPVATYNSAGLAIDGGF